MSHFRPDRLAVVSIRAEDVPATVHFYRHIVGLPLLPHHDHPPALELGSGQYLAIVNGQTAYAREPEVTRFPVLAFAVRDLDEAVQHFQSHGIELVRGIETGASERWITLYDPAGNLIEFVEFYGPPHS